jgi:hypothetical protein
MTMIGYEGEISFTGEDGTVMSLEEMQDTYENERRLEMYSKTIAEEQARIRKMSEANNHLFPFSILEEEDEDALQRYTRIRDYLLSERLKKEHKLSEENEKYFFRIERVRGLTKGILDRRAKSKEKCRGIKTC